MSPKVNDDYKEQKRQDILKAATEVFLRKGYSAATMKDVVEESGLSRGGVYLYFSSTEEMMVAIQEWLDQQNREQIEQLAEHHLDSVWMTIEGFVLGGRKDLESMAAGLAPALYEFYLNLYREGRHLDVLHRRYETSIELIEQLLRLGIKNGEFKPIASSRTIASMWVSLSDGMMLDCCMLGADRIALEDQLKVSLTMLKHLLGVQTK